jgi:imidazolonepropionase-like amidohydrolase
MRRRGAHGRCAPALHSGAVSFRAAHLAPLVAALLPVACAWLPAREPSEGAEPIVRLATAGPAVLLRGATVVTAAGPRLAPGDVLVRGSRIAAVAPRIDAPPDAEVVDLSGRFLTPGLIDPHSHMGVYAVPMVFANREGNEMSHPFTPQVRAEEGFWPGDPALRSAVAGGVTTIHVLPGSANLIGGQGVTLRMRPARSASEMRFEGAPTTMKLACGENPRRVYGRDRKRAPVTRMGEIAMLRQQLEKARAYDAKPRKEGAERDFGHEALVSVLRGETLIQNHCYRGDEMLLRIALYDEFDVVPRAFHHAVEAYKVRDALAEAGVGAVVWADWWGFKMEALDGVPANAALLDRAGVRVALHSDSPYDVQRLNQEAAKAMAAGRRAGLDVGPDDAIRWITANAAWVLGLEERTGTIEEGKEADLVVWSADPFSVYARAERVWVGGETVWDRSDPGSWPLADFQLGTGSRP